MPRVRFTGQKNVKHFWIRDLKIGDELYIWDYPDREGWYKVNEESDFNKRLFESRGIAKPVDSYLIDTPNFEVVSGIIRHYKDRTTRPEKPSALDTQHGGDHYKNKGIQPIEYINSNGMLFAEGSVVKYITRHQDKNGIEDLRKAIHFIQFVAMRDYPNEKI